jgi:hypothetical protein
MEYPQAYCEKWRVSKKPHRCCECRGTIFYKERYLYCSGVWDSRGASYKTCSDCAELRDEINRDNSYEEGVALGELRGYIFDSEYIPDISKFVDICDKRGVIVKPEIRQLIRIGKY